jgi:hypothetical protein
MEGWALRRLFPWIVAGLALVVIAPTLRSGWIGDDAFYSVLNGILGADRITLWQAMRQAFDLWFFGSGRFYPGLIVEKYLVFAVFANLLAYKLLIVAATLATLELFRRCVAAYTSRGLGNLAALVAAALLALHGYHDAILSYNAMPQVVAMLLLGSLIAFRRVLEGAGSGLRALSIALYAAAALTYEDVYGFSLLYVVIAAFERRSRRAVLAASWPYLAIAAGLALVSGAMRVAAGVPSYSPYGLSIVPAAVLRALGEQILAAFPLAYYLLDPSHIFGRSNVYDFFNNAPLNPIVFIAFVAALAYALDGAARERLDARGPIVVGAAVVVLAAAPIAGLVKYQTELKPGLGYLPVFFEEFGIALILASLAAITMRGSRRFAWQIAWSVVIAAIATVTAAANVRVVREDFARTQARQSLERQLDRGFLNGIPDGTFVTIPAPQDWIAYDGQGPEGISTRGLFYLHGAKRIHLVEPSDNRARIVLIYDPQAKRWTLRRR